MWASHAHIIICFACILLLPANGGLPHEISNNQKHKLSDYTYRGGGGVLGGMEGKWNCEYLKTRPHAHTGQQLLCNAPKYREAPNYISKTKTAAAPSP